MHSKNFNQSNQIHISLILFGQINITIFLIGELLLSLDTQFSILAFYYILWLHPFCFPFSSLFFCFSDHLQTSKISTPAQNPIRFFSFFLKLTMDDSISKFCKTMAVFCNNLENSCHALKESVDRRPIPLGITFLQFYLIFFLSN